MNCGSWLEIKNLGRFGLKIAMYLIFMKCGTRDKLNMLIINILTGIDDLDPKLQICKMWSPNWNVLQFLWNLALRTNWTCQLWIWYLELMIWNWWSGPKIIGSGKFVLSTESCSNFYEIWHSQQIERAYYECNTQNI